MQPSVLGPVRLERAPLTGYKYSGGGVSIEQLMLTDVLNSPSRAAIIRLGATEEGVLRSHMRMRDGRLRDSVIHGITAAEWPAVHAALLAKRHAARTRQP